MLINFTISGLSVPQVTIARVEEAVSWLRGTALFRDLHTLVAEVAARLIRTFHGHERINMQRSDSMCSGLLIIEV